MSKIEALRGPVTQVKNKVTESISEIVLGYPQSQTGIIERRPVQHEIFSFVGKNILTESSEVQTPEAIQKIRVLRLAGARIGMAPIHEAHFDATSIGLSLEKEGATDLANSLVFALGIRLERGFFSQLALRSQSIIRIWPPTEIPATPEERELKARLDDSAPRDLQDALDHTRIPVIFPQGTRAGKEREMLPARSSVIGLFDQIDLDYVVPVVIDGTQNILPKGGAPRRGSYGVTFCDPIDYKDLQDKHADKMYKPRRQAIMDEIMLPIARELPFERRGPYTDKA